MERTTKKENSLADGETRTHTHTHTHTLACTHTRMHTHTHTLACTHTLEHELQLCTDPFAHPRRQTRTQTQAHTRAHSDTDPLTHTNTPNNTHAQFSVIAGVVMITTLKRVLHYDCIICVKQYRPPLHAYTLEFPAGENSRECVCTCVCRSMCVCSCVCVCVCVRTVAFVCARG